MYSYVLYYNIEKSGFNAVSAYLLFFFKECMTVPSVKQVFFESSEKFGGRDSNIMGISALKG